MTEDEWNRCTDPQAMMAFLRTIDWARERKLRLFAAACVRRAWPLLTAERTRKVVEVAEAYADGQMNQKELDQARQAACVAHYAEMSSMAYRSASAAACSTADTYLPGVEASSSRAAYAEAGYACVYGPGQVTSYQHRLRALKRSEQAILLHDIFGPLPFRQVRIDTTWLTWNGSTVRRLAEEVYQERLLPSGHLDPTRLAVLADALEEAGADAELVQHLRGPGPHVRGCYVVDLLTSRE